MAQFKIDSGDSNTTIKNQVIEGTSYAGVLVSSPATEKVRNLVLKRWWVYNDAANGDRAKWLLLPYNWENALIEDCTFGRRKTELRPGVEGAWGEHNRYMHNPLGNYTERRVFGSRAGAQDRQFTCRWGESWEYKNGIMNGTEWYENVGTHLFEFCETRECGMPRPGGGGGMASYACSMFGKQMGISQGTGWGPRSEWDCPVIFRGETMYHTTQGQPAGWQLNGAYLVEWRPEALFEGCDCEYDGVADQDLVHAHMNERVIAREGPYMREDGTIGTRQCRFVGQRPFRINGVAAGRTKLIDIEPQPESTVDLIIDGVRKGPLAAGYHWVA